MLLEQILRDDIGCAAYVIGSESAGEAAVVDPRIDMVDEILALLEREGMQLRYVIETHNHADHVAGHHQLAARTGATIAVSASAGVDYPHLGLQDGDELAIGEVRLRAIHSPGHRPEHIAIAVIDTSRGDDPWAVLTGDTLFIGDVARPDLAIAGQEGADALFDTLHERLLDLPEGTLVYPGHVSGSLCGRVSNRMTSTTIGFERRFNPALLIESRAEFIRYMNESLPERPPNMLRIVELNRGSEVLELRDPEPLTVADVQRLQAEGGQLLDLRPSADFAKGYIPGSIGIPLDGAQFQNRVGLAISADVPLILVTATEEAAKRATTALAVIGYTQIAGFLDGGIEAWREAGGELDQIPELSVAELHDALNGGSAKVQLVDVREPAEWEGDHIPGAIHIPFYRLADQVEQIDAARPVALVCGSGERSIVGASILKAHGVTDAQNVAGGMSAWNAAHLPTRRSLAMTGQADISGEGTTA